MRSLPGTLPLLLVLALTACGGSDSSNSSGAFTPTASASTRSTGTFHDAPTQGLLYTATPSGLSGTTDADGHFRYELGDVVTFSLPLGSGTLVLGAYMPDGLNATLSVLSLPRGGLAAQLLQSLDHSATPDTLDVSGLTLTSTDFDNIAAWYDSDGQTLPPGKTAQQMLADAQAGASGSPAFTQPGAVSLTTALAEAQAEVADLIQAGTPSQAAAIVNNRILLHTGYGNYGPVAELLAFDASADVMTRISMTTNSGGGWTRTQGYSVTGDLIQLGDPQNTLQLHGTASSGLTAFTADIDLPANTPLQGAGNYRVLVNTPLDVRRQTLTIRGYAACADTRFVFSADGASWSAYCAISAVADGMSGPPAVIESGTASVDPERPQLLQLTNSCGVRHYLGVVNGSLASGTVAILTPATAALATGRLDHGLVIETGTTDAFLLRPFTGSCEGAGAGTPASAFYTGKTFSGSFVGIGGLEGQAVLEVDGAFAGGYVIRLPLDATSFALSFYQLPESGAYTVRALPGCTVQNGSGNLETASTFTVDCSGFAGNTAAIAQGGWTTLLGDHEARPSVSLMEGSLFTLTLPALPDSVPVQVCAINNPHYWLELAPGTALADHPCFASGTGMAMAANPTPETGMPLYVRSNANAHNHYSTARRVTTAETTTVYIDEVSFVDGASAGPFTLVIVADLNGNGLAEAGEIWQAGVSLSPPPGPSF
jgi:hypothetical protein